MIALLNCIWRSTMDFRRATPLFPSYLFLSLPLLLIAQQDSQAVCPRSQQKMMVAKDGLRYVWIPGGRFEMGCSPSDANCASEEGPPHQVMISRGFWMGQTEVTVEAYRRYADANGKSLPPDPASHGSELNPAWSRLRLPIVDVTWNDAQAYCAWTGGRLPTDAEWEYAARAGSTDRRYGPLDDIAWYADNSGRERLDSQAMWKDDPKNYNQRLKQNGNKMHEVAQKGPNAFGLYDMLGNVREWCGDWYEETYLSIKSER